MGPLSDTRSPRAAPLAVLLALLAASLPGAGLGLGVRLGPPAEAPMVAPAVAEPLDLQRLDGFDTPFLVDEDGDTLVGDLVVQANLTVAVGDFACGGCVGAGDLGPAAVQAPHLAPGAVTPPALAARAVTAEALAPGAVTAPALASGAVTAPALAAGAVTAGAIAPGAVGAGHLADGSVTPRALGPDVLRPFALLGGYHPPGSTAFYTRVLHPLSTAPTSDDAASPGKVLVARRDGVLAGFAVVAEGGGLGPGERMTLEVMRNGQPTGLALTVDAATPAGTLLEDPDRVLIQAGDRLALRASTGLGSARFLAFGWTLEYLAA